MTFGIRHALIADMTQEKPASQIGVVGVVATVSIEILVIEL